jgi:hypothetical protein
MEQDIINSSNELASQESWEDCYCFHAIAAFETLNKDMTITAIMMDIPSSPAMTVEFCSPAVMTNFRSVA